MQLDPAMKSTSLRIEGSVASGQGRGAQFLGLQWVRRELRRKAGLDPFPGTLNLRIPAGVWSDLYARRAGFLKIDDPSSGGCPGFLKRVVLQAHGQICSSAYLIFPALTIYQDVLEIIAAENLREKLGLKDGDPVRVEEFPESTE